MKKIIGALILSTVLNQALASDAMTEMMRMMMSMMRIFLMAKEDAPKMPLPVPTPMPNPLPSSQCRNPKLEDVQGEWQNETQTRLAIKQKYARMLFPNHQYQNFFVEVLPPRLRLTHAESGQVQEFELEFNGQEMILKDNQGRSTRFRPVEQPTLIK